MALWGFNTIEWYLSFLAASRAGFVVVCLDFGRKPKMGLVFDRLTL